MDGFVLALKDHDIIYSVVPEDASVKMSQSQCAKKLAPPVCWNSRVTKLGWQFKWSLNGIQPVRAVVIVTQDVTIPSGKIFVFG